MIVCFWANVRFRRLVFGGTLRAFFCNRLRIHCFFVIRCKLRRYAAILEVDGLDKFKISDRGVERLYPRIEAFVECENLFNQFSGDWSRDLPARLRSLYQDG